ncbi:hypothetical protein ACHAXT_009473 [Thalassiosira profunda]
MNSSEALALPADLAQLVKAAVERGGGDHRASDLLARLPTKSLREMNDACWAELRRALPTAAAAAGESDAARGADKRPAKRQRSTGSEPESSRENASSSDTQVTSDAPRYDEGVHLRTAPVALAEPPAHRCPRYLAALLYNLALAHQQRNQDDAALQLFQLAHDVLQTAGEAADGPAPSHVDRMALLHNIGCLHYRRKEYDLALEAFAKVEVLAVARHGRRHPAVASALNCVGVALFHGANGTKSQAKETLALNSLLESLSLRKELLGPDHNDVATTLNNVGRVHFDSGEYKQALQYYRESLQIRRKLLGGEHLDVAAAAFNAGQACQRLGKLDKALALYQEYHRITSTKLGRRHKGEIAVLKHMGQVCHEKGRTDEAARHYREALGASREVLGRSNREAASILNLLGNLHYEQGAFDKAIEVYEQGLVVERAVLPRHCPNFVVTLSNIGQALMQKGDYRAALDRYKEVHFLLSLQPERNVKKLSETLSVIGQIHTLLEMYPQAERAFLTVVSLTKDLPARTDAGEGDLDVALALNYLGLVYFKQGSLNSAMEKFQESLRVRMRSPTTSGDVAVLLYNIASIHLHKGDNDAALEHYQRALEVERSALGTDHPDVATTLRLIGKVYDRCGRFDEAVDVYREAYDIYRRCFDDSAMSDRSAEEVREIKKNAAQVLSLLASVHLKQADVAAMTRALSRAHQLFAEIGEPPRELQLEAGFELYELSILHPECAAAA